MSRQVTGTGCATTAVIGAFMGIEPAFEAALHGLTVMKRAATRAASDAAGPGSFSIRMIDAIAADHG
jgi:hydroxyethylthiazole kinase